MKSSASWRLVALGLCAITLAMPVVTWLVSTDGVVAYLSHSLPAGQSAYVFSKLLGLLAIVLLWLQIMAALAKRSPVLQGFVRLSGAAHALLGAMTLATIVTHAVLFIVASSMRTKHAAFDLLLPTFTHGYYRTFVSLGVIGFWISLMVVLAGCWRTSGHRAWRWVHKLAFAVFAAGFLHGISIGSETRFGLMMYVYAFMGLSLCAASLSLLWSGLRRPSILAGAKQVGVVHD
jgi:predicted ferric reductase